MGFVRIEGVTILHFIHLSDSHRKMFRIEGHTFPFGHLHTQRQKYSFRIIVMRMKEKDEMGGRKDCDCFFPFLLQCVILALVSIFSSRERERGDRDRIQNVFYRSSDPLLFLSLFSFFILSPDL